jgi:hypothetical protein
VKLISVLNLCVFWGGGHCELVVVYKKSIMQHGVKTKMFMLLNVEVSAMFKCSSVSGVTSSQLADV